MQFKSSSCTSGVRYCLPLIPETLNHKAYTLNSIQEILCKLEWHPQLSLEKIHNNTHSERNNFDYYNQPPRYSCCEIWLDYLEVNSQNQHEYINTAQSLITSYPDRIILILRRLALAKPQISAEVRQQLLMLVDQNQSWVDLDVSTQKSDLNFVRTHAPNLKLITSYHNYHQTPSSKELAQIKLEMARYRPRIFKFATYCQTRSDALRLCRLQESLLKEGLEHIVLGMGAEGLITRIFGSWWGNYLCFAPPDLAQASAPGQLTLKQLHRFLKELNDLNNTR